MSDIPRYVIECDARGVVEMSARRDQKATVMRVKRVLHELGPDIHWQHSYIGEDKIYCVFITSGEEIIH